MLDGLEILHQLQSAPGQTRTAAALAAGKPLYQRLSRKIIIVSMASQAVL